MSYVHASLIRFRRLIWVGIVAFGLLVLLLAVTRQQLSSQGNTVREIAVAAPHSSAYQFAGRIDQNGVEFTGYGYLYDIKGVAPNELFTNPLNPSETTAHFTYYATATLTSRAVVTDAVRGIFALDSVGQITFYYQPNPSATFGDPQSFAGGTAIAAASMRFQDILSVQAPNRGIAVGNGEFSVFTAESFTLGEETVRFGRPGILYQISTFGDALRTDPIIPLSSVLLAGTAVDSGYRQTYLPAVSNSETP